MLNSEDQEENPIAAAIESDRIPPFTLLMLLAWVAICAVLFEFWRQTGLMGREVLWQSLMGMQLATWSAGLSGLGLRVWWWQQGRSIPWQPGHWLLCLVGCVGLVPILTKLLQLLFWQLDPFPASTGLWIQENVRLFLSVASILAIWGVVWFASLPRVWAIVVLPEAITRSFSLAMQIYVVFNGTSQFPFGSDVTMALTWILGVIALAGPLLILIVPLWDVFISKQERDWMHWTGVAAWGLLILQPYLMTIVWLTSRQ